MPYFVERKLERLLIDSGKTIRDALGRLNDSGHLLQLVVDRDGRLVGTIADGDIRRALVRGHTLTEPISECMNKNPVTAFNETDALACIVTVQSKNAFVPLVDDEGRPVGVLVSGGEMRAPEVALVLAGGFGRRLKERTHSIPKPLIPVGGRPILEHVLKNLEWHGIKRIYIAVHYLADKIRLFVDKRASVASIELLEEVEPLGTGGSIGLLPSSVQGDILVVNADVISRIDLAAMYGRHLLGKHRISVGATTYSAEIPFGVIEHDEEGNIHGIVEKPVQSFFVSAGIYIVRRDAGLAMPAAARFDMPDLIKAARQAGQTVGIFPIHEYWADLGTPSALALADQQIHIWNKE
jgi:dTDP-glucose pyrophosphorylase